MIMSLQGSSFTYFEIEISKRNDHHSKRKDYGDGVLSAAASAEGGFRFRSSSRRRMEEE